MVQHRVGELLLALHAAERLDVLFGLLLDHVDDVVEGDHADHAVPRIDHRRCDQVVALEAARHRFLVLGRAHDVALRLHQVGHRHRALGARQPVERHRAEQALIAVDHVELEEPLGQILGFAHVVDRLPDGPGRRHRDELGLHPPSGGLFRIVEALRQRDTIARRHLLEDLGLVLLGQVLEDVDRVVGIEIAHAFGDGAGLQLFEDLLAHRVVDFGQRREVEILAHQLDELRPQIRVERLDQVAGIGFVQLADQRAREARVAAPDRLGDGLDEFGADRAGLVAQGRGGAGAFGVKDRRLGQILLGQIFLVDHAGLGASCAIGAFSGEVDTGSPQKTRPLRENRCACTLRS